MTHRRAWIAFLLFSLTLINYLDRATLSFAIFPIAKEFDLSSVEKGWLLSSFTWAYTVMVVPMGMLVDRHGARKVAGIGIFVWSLATLCTGFMPSFTAILLSRLVMGGGEASTNPAGAQVIREWFPVRERGVLNAVFNGGAYIGPALCALVAAPIIGNLGWRTLFYSAGALGFVWLAAWLLSFHAPEHARWLPQPERERILTGRSGGAAATQEGPSGLWQLLKGGPTLWFLALMMGCNVYSLYVFLTWIPSYLRDATGLSLGSTGGFTAIIYVTAFCLSLAFAYGIDRALRGRDVAGGDRRYFVAGSMTVAAILALVPMAHSLPVLVVMLAVSLAGIATTAAQAFSLVNDLLPRRGDIGVAMGFVVLGGNIFGMAGPVVTGYVVQASGSFDWAFVIAGGLLLLGALCLLTVIRVPIGLPWGPSARPGRIQHAK
jgi:ACS family glucarate transporter-like MFS transporter